VLWKLIPKTKSQKPQYHTHKQPKPAPASALSRNAHGRAFVNSSKPPQEYISPRFSLTLKPAKPVNARPRGYIRPEIPRFRAYSVPERPLKWPGSPPATPNYNGAMAKSISRGNGGARQHNHAKSTSPFPRYSLGSPGSCPATSVAFRHRIHVEAKNFRPYVAAGTGVNGLYRN